MICPLCGAELVVTYTPTMDNLHTIYRAECHTDKAKTQFSHYSNDDYGIQIVVLPYVINYSEGDGYCLVSEVDHDGLPIGETVLPVFKIPPMDQFLDKLKTLLLFS